MIEPVMSVEEWKAPQDVINGYIDRDTGIIDVVMGGGRDTAALIAILNDTLSASSPYKITREHVERLRQAAHCMDEAGIIHADGDDLRVVADLIEALLPVP